MGAIGAQADDNGRSHQKDLGNAVSLLEQALALLDGSEAPPEIGARLQEVIDALRAQTS